MVNRKQLKPHLYKEKKKVVNIAKGLSHLGITDKNEWRRF